MNKHIIAMVHPFVVEQEVRVYDNGECIKITSCTLDNIENTILTLANQYNIKQIDLAGSQIYNLKIRDNMNANTNFNKNELNITIH